MCPRRGTFFSCLAKKRRQKKATLLSATLRFAPGNLRCLVLAGARSNSRLRRSDDRGGGSANPSAPEAHTEGGGSPTSTRAIAALGPKGRRRYAPRTRGRAQRWPERAVFSPPLVAAPAAGCLRGGMRAPARMLRELTCRVCLNGARQREVSYAAHPASAPTQVCPAGVADCGSPFLCLLSFGEAKESESAAGPRPGLRPQQSAISNQQSAISNQQKISNQ